MPRRRNRTFTGCWKCRSRKVKCDETRPHCRACLRIGAVCSGYTPRFVWVENENQAQKSDGRRILQCQSTWAGLQTLTSDLVDLLIRQCDDEDYQDLEIVQSSCNSPPHNPFSVFPTSSAPGSWSSPVVLTEPSSPIPRALTASPDFASTEQSLFHHYVSHVAVIMMPYEHPRNIWKLHYPATALCHSSSAQSALYNAMLAQAAFNIAYLRGDDNGMIAVGSKYYDAAIKQLVPSIQHADNDFGALLASIMTLMFAELYSGPNQKWRHHLEGAWVLFREYWNSEPWKITDSVCVALQSLNIIKIIGDTSSVALGDGNEIAPPRLDERQMLSSISSTSGFGFTIGAPQVVLDCISRINQFHNTRSYLVCDGEGERLLETILSSLNACPRDEVAVSDQNADLQANCFKTVAVLEGSQRNAFIYATYIYLYRTLLNVPPHTVRPYVSKIFQNISRFYSHSNGNFSIWPAFIAAVEAHTDEDLAAARAWLDWATSFGLGSRTSVRRVLEEVWQRRKEESRNRGSSRGTITIDWREVMHELGCDVLLV